MPTIFSGNTDTPIIQGGRVVGYSHAAPSPTETPVQAPPQNPNPVQPPAPQQPITPATPKAPNYEATQPSQANSTTVNSYVDNSDGTTTVKYADGTSDTGTYTKNTDGTYTYKPIQNYVPSQADSYKSQYEQAAKEYYDEAKRVSDTITNIQNGSIPLSTGEQAQISALQQSYQNMISQQQLQNTGATGEANIRGYQTGSAEYDPTFQAKTIGNIITAGNQKVLDLNTEMAGAVAKMTQGFRDADIAAAKDAYSVYKDAATKRIDTIKNMVDDANAQIKAAQEAQQKQQDAVSSIATDAAKNGAPPDVQAAISAASGPLAAIAAAGNWLATDDYSAYVRAAQAAGQTPVDPTTYYQKKWSLTSGSSGGSLGGANYDAGSVPFQSTIEAAVPPSLSNASQKQQLQRMENLANAGDYPGLLTAIEDGARKSMTASTASDVFTAQNQIKSLKNMSDVLKEYQAAGGKMDYLKGNADEVARKIGALATDKRFASIATQMTAAFQQYRQNMTGAAFGAKENADYAKIFPTATKSFELNQAVIDGLTNYYTQNVDNAYTTQLGDGYTNLKNYVDNGLTPSGAYFVQNEKQAQSVLMNVYSKDPQVQQKADAFKKDNPNASATDVMAFLGIPYTSDKFAGAKGSSSGNRPQRNNNPLNIKASGSTKGYDGVAGVDPVPAADGGQFLTFATPQDGLNAAKKLLSTQSYKGLTVDQALKRWSNNGYGGEIAPSLKGKTISQLSSQELDSLINAMAKREGYYA